MYVSRMKCGLFACCATLFGNVGLMIHGPAINIPDAAVKGLVQLNGQMLKTQLCFVLYCTSRFVMKNATVVLLFALKNMYLSHPALPCDFVKCRKPITV